MSYTHQGEDDFPVALGQDTRERRGRERGHRRSLEKLAPVQMGCVHAFNLFVNFRHGITGAGRLPSLSFLLLRFTPAE